jgi:hypothetical protein
LRDLRDDGVTEAFKTVHPSGYPMSHSTHVGFNAPPIAAFKGRLCRSNCEDPALFDASCAVGVGHVFTAECNVSGWPRCRPLSCSARGVGHIARLPASARAAPSGLLGISRGPIVVSRTAPESDKFPAR